MRSFLCLVSWLTLVAVSLADPLPDPQPVTWQQPFTSVSASQADTSLNLMLITNDDPFDRSTRPAAKTKNFAHGWCAPVMESSYRRLLNRRPDLRSRLNLQSIRAGMPLELTAGQDRNQPARAVVALCDGHYRLLAFMIGVPEFDSLLSLIEDGEEVATMRGLHADAQSKMQQQLVDRSSQRVNRLWQTSLQKVAEAIAGELGDGSDGVAARDQTIASSLRLLVETYEPIYLNDVKLRFGLRETTDATRLVILEQHPEARRPWCQAMLPFVAGADFASTWRMLVESVWGYAPITADQDVDGLDLVQWFDAQIATEQVVLAIAPALRQSHLVWPPATDDAASRGVGWQQVHAMAIEHPFRVVDLQQLAALMHARDLQAVDIEQPSRARYLFFEPQKKLPLVIRQTDPPGRFAGVLKRSNSRLVSENEGH